MKLRQQRQRGIALVITLIMLAVTLVMAVAFLAISTRDRGSVGTSTDATHSREASESALAAAESQIMASMLATTKPYNFGMFVSTNYITQSGFLTLSGPGTGIASPTNVNYYYPNGFPVTGNDYEINLANLWYLPRAPVFVTNSYLGDYDFRFYLDLNRNGVFDANNSVTNWVLNSDNTFSNLGPTTEIGDPEWIGVLEHPDQPHGPLNHFIGRYAFIAVPVGNTLDVNAIYNDATLPGYPKNATMPPGDDGYLRNEGVGSWEINLAAFLADLNTNEWDVNNLGYDYRTALPGNLNNVGAVNFPNTGVAFDDALSLLRYRYNYNFYNQTNVTQYANYQIFAQNNIDDFSDGPLMTNSTLPPDNDLSRSVTEPWAGSDNTNHFFSLSDFFSPSIFRPAGYGISAATPEFPDRLLNAGTNWHVAPLAGGGMPVTNIPTYDRYTFYRMLSELGSDSTPDFGKMNLNYVNINSAGQVVPGMETNFIPWNAPQFFTNAADRLLKTYTTNWYYGNYAYFTNTFGVNIGPFGVTNIPVWVNGQFVYTPSVNRLLQLAANLYDASTNSFFPSVFRPTFFRDPVTGNVFINGYTQIDTVNFLTASSDPSNPLFTPVDISALVASNIPAGGGPGAQGLNNINVYGVPWIIGAKKGFPSFNQLYMINNAQVARKLQVNRSSDGASYTFTTNEMFLMGITNTVGMSCWNSYNSNYVSVSGNITVYMQDTMRMKMTNSTLVFPNNNPVPLVFTNIQNFQVWPGSSWDFSKIPPTTDPVGNNPGFVSVLFSNVFMPTSYYRTQTQNWYPIGTNDPSPDDWEVNVVNNYLFPQSGLTTINYAQAFILDGNKVIDYVQFAGPNVSRNIAADLADPNYPDSSGVHYMWSTNSSIKSSLAAPPAFGEYNQILLSRGIGGITAPPGPGAWTSVPSPGGSSPGAQQAFFNGFWNFSDSYTYLGVLYSNLESTVQAPYTPSKPMPYFTNWVANDPMVHFLSSDLAYNYPGKSGLQNYKFVPPSLNQVSDRYQPWGVASQMAGLANVDKNPYNLAYKDPLVWGPDYWSFPTNLYPTVGWIGRVHRGTPWQTVYLKSTDEIQQYTNSGQNLINLGTNTWMNWSGNTGNLFDATNAAPVKDRLLFDIFTTGPNENATLGELSVNQPHFAAWSALLSGMTVYTNLTGTNAIIQPGGIQGTNSAVGYIWSSIQQTRLNTNLFYLLAFARAGDVLASPGLTVNSPYLPWADPSQQQFQNQISDQMYEWLPQQMMSLVKLGTPRYVIYCYGQALRPAKNGIITSGPYALMVTNYQIVSESAVRAVVQVENANTGSPHVVLKNVSPLPPDQ